MFDYYDVREELPLTLDMIEYALEYAYELEEAELREEYYAE